MKTLSITIEEILAEHFNPTTRTEVRKKIVKEIVRRDDFVRGVGEVRKIDMENVEQEIGYSEALEFVRKRQKRTL